MLQLKNISDPLKIEMEFDFYVPINIKFINPDEMFRSHPIYWRTGDLEKSLIEIGLEKENGKLRSITLVSAKSSNVKRKDMKISQDIKIEIKGNPLFKTNEWENKKDFLDIVQEFEVYIGKEAVTITFSSKPIVLKVINGRVIFGFDTNKKLCLIKIKEITPHEKLELENYLEKNLAN